MDIPSELLAATKAAEPTLIALPGVVGVGVGLREANGQIFNELAVRVLVRPGLAVPAGIPETIGGVSVSIVEADIQPCTLPSPDTKRYAQIAGGIQITWPQKGAGTLGCVVQDANTGELLGLSCYHVVGDPNSVFPNTIWQPTNPPLVVGSAVPPVDNIGSVVRVDFPQTPPLPFSPLLVGMVDAAVISLTTALNQGRLLLPAILGQDDQQPNLADRVTATDWPNPADEVLKRGAVTRVTSGIILGMLTSVQWTAGPSNAYLIEQFELAGSSSNPDGIFAQNGDSGAVILRKNTPTAVGLLGAHMRLELAP